MTGRSQKLHKQDDGRPMGRRQPAETAIGRPDEQCKPLAHRITYNLDRNSDKGRQKARKQEEFVKIMGFKDHIKSAFIIHST